MGTRSSMRIVLLATFTVASLLAVGQNQGQTQQTQQAPAQQGQQQPAQQQAPQKSQKKSIWQRIQDASQRGQNTVNGTVQKGQDTVQSTVQQGQGTVQNGQDAVQNTVQQGTGVLQNGAQSAIPGSQGSGAFSGGGAGAGSCGSNCFDAGPFQANVSQMTMSQEGGWHIVRMNIQFHNSTDQPLIIAYHDGSMVMVDNNGNTYVPAGGNPGQLQGMGIDRGQQTDSSFVLGPGQTGNALFSVARGRPETSPIGTGYSYNLTIDELQAQNGALAIPVRQYSLNFPSLVPGSSNANTGFASTAPANNVVPGGKGAAIGSAAGGTVARGNSKVPASTAVPAGQQQMVNGRPVNTPPNAVVKNAAMTSPATTTAKQPASVVKPIPTAATTAKPAAAVKPISAAAVKPIPAPTTKPTAAVKPIPTAVKAATPAKKAATTTTPPGH